MVGRQRLDADRPAGLSAVPGPSGPSIRTAGFDDVAALVGLVESAYRGEASRAGWTTEADLLEGQRTDAAAVSDILSRPESIVVLAEAAGEPVGCFHLERRAGGAAYFGMFAVSPTRQGGGLGRALLAEAARLAAEWDCDRIEMTVIRQREDLIAWYRRVGFAADGRTQPFPYGDERFGRPLRDDLEFVVLAASVDRLGSLRRG